MKFIAPKRWLNATLFYLGCCGVIFQLIAWFCVLWLNFPVHQHEWWTWAAPISCILWGIVPALQLQTERTDSQGSHHFDS